MVQLESVSPLVRNHRAQSDEQLRSTRLERGLKATILVLPQLSR